MMVPAHIFNGSMPKTVFCYAPFYINVTFLMFFFSVTCLNNRYGSVPYQFTHSRPFLVSSVSVIYDAYFLITFIIF